MFLDHLEQPKKFLDHLEQNKILLPYKKIIPGKKLGNFSKILKFFLPQIFFENFEKKLPQISIFIIFRPFGATKKIFRPFGAKQNFSPL